MIALGVLALAAPIAVVAGVVWWRDFDRSLDREVRESWAVNGDRARDLAEKHAAHPEVARELARRMAEEKARREAGPQVSPPRGV